VGKGDPGNRVLCASTGFDLQRSHRDLKTSYDSCFFPWPLPQGCNDLGVGTARIPRRGIKLKGQEGAGEKVPSCVAPPGETEKTCIIGTVGVVHI